jgi:hypothetical protein
LKRNTDSTLGIRKDSVEELFDLDKEISEELRVQENPEKLLKKDKSRLPKK